ncbi:MAG: S4 domain-containing protein [Desulfotomaculaceae bacterium]
MHLGHTGFVWLLKLIQQAGLCSSTSEARRLIQQGAVKVDGERFADTEQKLRPQSGMVIKAGKRKFLRIK